MSETAQTWFVARCPECGQVKTFDTEQARGIWLRNHSHQEYPA